MNRCTDERLGRMLYAYELGMLAGDDRRKLELHLLDCRYCSEQVQAFSKTVDAIKSDNEIQQELPKLAKMEEESARSMSSLPVRPRWASLRFWIRASLAPVAIIILLLLHPWRLDFEPSHDLVAAENRLMILTFDVVSSQEGDELLGEIVANLLSIDLSESEYMTVLSQHRVRELLRLNKADSSAAVPANWAINIARNGQANWLLQGSVIRENGLLAITSRLTDVSDGTVAAGSKLVGTPAETTFDLVDRLTIQVKKDLRLPQRALSENDPLVADVTTHSPIAYRFYLEGIEQASKLYSNEAIASFERALEFDSSFAMAYYYLSGLKDRRLIHKAAELADEASHRERFYIHARQAIVNGDIAAALAQLRELSERYPDEKEALYLLGSYSAALKSYEDAVTFLRQATTLDPTHKLSYNRLAYVYDQLGDFDQALAALNKYIEIAPDEPNPYDSKGQICAWNGRLEMAIEAYRQALAIEPHFPTSLMYLGYMYTYHHDYDSAMVMLRRFASLPGPIMRSAGRLYQAYVPLYSGNLSRALDVLDDGITADNMEAEAADLDKKYMLKAIICAGTDRCSEALQSLRRVRDAADTAGVCRLLHLEVQLLAQCGEVERAQSLADTLENHQADSLEAKLRYWYAEGALAWSAGKVDSAEYYFASACDSSSDFHHHYWLARTLFEQKKFSEAIAELEFVTTRYTSPRLYLGLWSMEGEYYLARAYEGLGQARHAIDSYQRLLQARGEADTTIAFLNDARRRLDRLMTKH